MSDDYTTWLPPLEESHADVLAREHRRGEHGTYRTRYCPLCMQSVERKERIWLK